MDNHEISHIIKGVTLLEGIFACRINNASNLVSLNKITKYLKITVLQNFIKNFEVAKGGRTLPAFKCREQ